VNPDLRIVGIIVIGPTGEGVKVGKTEEVLVWPDEPAIRDLTPVMKKPPPIRAGV
jgi:hypothetical protein